MSEWMSAPLASAVTFILDTIRQFSEFHFPGTEIPIVIVMLAPAGLYLCWRVIYKWVFDMGG